VVTIDIGFNDIRPCINTSTIDQSCFSTGLDQVRTNLPVLISALRRSAGPKVYFVGLLYADPFVADYLAGSTAARARAALTLHDMSQLNDVLSAAYRAQGVSIADIPAAYHSEDSTPTSLEPYGTVPTNVKYACLYTWICTSDHDDHANALGYAAEAGVILRALPATLP
jgi:lysophospholipase L1-like esterase